MEDNIKIDLSQGDTGVLMDINVQNELLKELRKTYQNGLEEDYGKLQPETLINCVREHFIPDILNIQTNNDEIVVSALSSTMIFKESLKIFCQNGNKKALILSPYFKGYGRYAQDARVKLVPIDFSELSNFKITPNILRKYFQDKDISCLIMNIPNNPFGTTYSREELIEISKVALDFGIKIISDDLFAIPNKKQRHITFASLEFEYKNRLVRMKDHAITILGNSKSHSVGNIGRLGVGVSGDTELIKLLRNYINNTLPPFQSDGISAITTILKHTPKSFYDLIIQKTSEDLRYATEMINKINQKLGGNFIKIISAGVFFLCITFDSNLLKRNNIDTSEKLRECLLNRVNVDSVSFDMMFSNFIALRINVCGPRINGHFGGKEAITAGINRIEKFLYELIQNGKCHDRIA